MKMVIAADSSYLTLRNFMLLHLFNGCFAGQPGYASIRKVNHSGF